MQVGLSHVLIVNHFRFIAAVESFDQIQLRGSVSFRAFIPIWRKLKLCREWRECVETLLYDTFGLPKIMLPTLPKIDSIGLETGISQRAALLRLVWSMPPTGTFKQYTDRLKITIGNTIGITTLYVPNSFVTRHYEVIHLSYVQRFYSTRFSVCVQPMRQT